MSVSLCFVFWEFDMKKELIMNTEEFVKNRKYVAVVKEDRPYLWDTWKFSEGFEEEYGFCIFGFSGFTHASEEVDGIYLHFEDSLGFYTVRLDDVYLYKKETPPILKKIKNKFKHNQI